jgi:hypothetical protein
MKQTSLGWWHDWPMDFSDVYDDPSDEDVSKRPYLLASAALRFSVPHARLPQPSSARHTADELTDLASQAVAIVVDELNRIIWPVIQALETS